MNTNEAAQYLGYRDIEHLEMQDISEYSLWWTLIKHLTSEPVNKSTDSSFCLSQTKNLLCDEFVRESKKHIGEIILDVPELCEILRAIKVVEKMIKNKETLKKE